MGRRPAHRQLFVAHLNMIGPSHERRAHARAPHHTQATVTTGRGDIPAEVFDLSVGGLGLRMDASVHRGEFIRIRVQLPTERGPAWFDPDAVVSRVEQGSGRGTVGIAFVSPPVKLQQVLAARVSAHATRPAAPSRPVLEPTPAAKPTAPAFEPPAPRVSKRELAELFRDALQSVADDPRAKKKRRGRA